MAILNHIYLNISKQNSQVKDIIESIEADYNHRKGSLSHELCKLIIAGSDAMSGTTATMARIPRFDKYHRELLGARHKCLTQALSDGEISEQELVDMYMSSKKFIEEMYRSKTIQNIIKRRGIDIGEIILERYF
jgi:hypothetical protein